MYAAHMTVEEELLLLRSEASSLRRKTARTDQSLLLYKEKAEKLEKENETLRKRIRELEDQAGKLTGELEKVKRQRDAYRGMVFKPKRTNHLQEKTGKKRGGQEGHVGHGRIRASQIDETKRVFHAQCPTCHTPLPRSESLQRHTVEDIPAPSSIHPSITEYQMERQWCSTCKKTVVGIPPEVIPNARFGLNLIIQLLIWRYGCRIPFAGIVFLFSHTYGIDVSEGALVGILHRVRKWFGPSYKDILSRIRGSPVKHADETSWSIVGVKSWMWAFLTQTEVCYTIEESRGKGVAQTMLAGSKETDVLVRDGLKSYEKIPVRHQSCWAHPIRYSREAAKRSDASKEMKTLNKRIKRFYGDVAQVVETPFDQKRRQTSYDTLKKRLDDLCVYPYTASDAQSIQGKLTNQKDMLLTAVLVDGVPLTNNLAERMIRPLVITRKISGASQSEEGAQTHAVNMSVFQTIRMRDQDIISTLRSSLLHGIFGKD